MDPPRRGTNARRSGAGARPAEDGRVSRAVSMMTLGVTGAFGFEDFPQPQVLSLYAAADCRLVQVYRNRERAISARDVLATVRDLPVRIDSIHGHFGDDLDPSSLDESMRRRTIEGYRGEADYCRELGGDLVVVHPSPGKAAVGDVERRYAQLRHSMTELARVGEQAGVRFAFENMPPYHPVGSDVARLVRVVAATASAHVVFLLDTGHAHMVGGLAEAIRAAGPNLAYTHIHDNDGQNDTHRLPYRGTIDWDACRRALHDVRYDGVFLLEVFESAADIQTHVNADWTARIKRILRNNQSDGASA